MDNGGMCGNPGIESKKLFKVGWVRKGMVSRKDSVQRSRSSSERLERFILGPRHWSVGRTWPFDTSVSQSRASASWHQQRQRQLECQRTRPNIPSLLFVLYVLTPRPHHINASVSSLPHSPAFQRSTYYFPDNIIFPSCMVSKARIQPGISSSLRSIRGGHGELVAIPPVTAVQGAD